MFSQSRFVHRGFVHCCLYSDICNINKHKIAALLPEDWQFAGTFFLFETLHLFFGLR